MIITSDECYIVFSLSLGASADRKYMGGASLAYIVSPSCVACVRPESLLQRDSLCAILYIYTVLYKA